MVILNDSGVRTYSIELACITYFDNKIKLIKNVSLIFLLLEAAIAVEFHNHLKYNLLFYIPCNCCFFDITC